MGVVHLWKLLKPHCKEVKADWKTLSSQTLAVDLSFWIVEAATAMKHVSDPTFKPHLRNLFFRIKHLSSMGIRLIFVLDGAPPKEKFNTLKKRGCLGNVKKRKQRKKFNNSKFRRQCRECVRLLEILGIPFIDLEIGEAEAFCAQLNVNGFVDGVLTPDGDGMLLYIHYPSHISFYFICKRFSLAPIVFILHIKPAEVKSQSVTLRMISQGY